MERDGSARGDARGAVTRWVLRLLFVGIGAVGLWALSATAASASPLGGVSDLIDKATASVQQVETTLDKQVQKVETKAETITKALPVKPVDKIVSTAKTATKVVDKTVGKTVDKASGVVHKVTGAPNRIIDKVVEQPAPSRPQLPGKAEATPAGSQDQPATIPPASIDPAPVIPMFENQARSLQAADPESAATQAKSGTTTTVQQPALPVPLPGDDNPGSFLADAATVVNNANNRLPAGQSGILLAGIAAMAATFYLGRSSQLRGGAVSRIGLVPVTPD